MTTRGMPLGSEFEDGAPALGIARRHHLARRLVVAPQARAVGRAAAACRRPRCALSSVTTQAGVVQHLAVDLDAAGVDPALGIAARAEAGARQALGDALAFLGGLFAHVVAAASQEGAEQLRVALGDQELGMPLHAEAEAIGRRLDALDHAVRARSR